MTDSPLGKSTTFPEDYSPDSLFALPRAENRARLDIGDELPFGGLDIWNAWELTWLGPEGQPRVGTAEIRIPASSPNIIESKSMKLYLGSFAMSRYASAVELRDTIAGDLATCAGSPVDVDIIEIAVTAGRRSRKLPGKTLDRLHVECDSWEVDPKLLVVDHETYVNETLHTDLLRGLCPVTGQPDSGISFPTAVTRIFTRTPSSGCTWIFSRAADPSALRYTPVTSAVAASTSIPSEASSKTHRKTSASGGSDSHCSN
jgi:7-cyano-7-deazaguanine reductase